MWREFYAERLITDVYYLAMVTNFRVFVTIVTNFRVFVTMVTNFRVCVEYAKEKPAASHGPYIQIRDFTVYTATDWMGKLKLKYSLSHSRNV